MAVGSCPSRFRSSLATTRKSLAARAPFADTQPHTDSVKSTGVPERRSDSAHFTEQRRVVEPEALKSLPMKRRLAVPFRSA